MRMRRRLTQAVACGLLLFPAATACSDDPEPENGSNQGDRGTTNPAAQVVELLNEGIEFAEEEDYGKAREAFERVIELDETNKYAWYNLGVVASAQGEPSEALEHYDRALSTDPEFTSAMYNKAILLEESDPDAAIGIYEQIIELNPEASTSRFRLGMLLADRGDTAAAAENFATAVEMDPDLERFVPREFQPDDAAPAPTTTP